MDARFGKALRGAIIGIACEEYGLLAALVLWALWVQLNGGMGDMPFHLLALILALGAAAVGLAPGFVVYRVSVRSCEPRNVAFAWGALAAVIGPVAGYLVASHAARIVPTWVCFVLGGVIAIVLPLAARAIARRIAPSP
jgi:hypothetical protein